MALNEKNMNTEYNSREDKQLVFGKQNMEWIDTIDDYNSVKKSLWKHKLIYRGLNEAKYKLYTSLQRQFLSNKVNRNRYPTLFDFMKEEINQIKLDKVLPKYYKALGAPVTDYLYMSFLQHYGAPTTLMDFSEDIDIALYFATQDVAYKMDGALQNHISNYVSLYWIDPNEKEEGSGLISIYEKVLKNCINGMDHLLKDSTHEINSSQLESEVGRYLSFSNLKDVNLGVLWGDNDSRYKRLFSSSDKYYSELQDQICSSLRTASRSAAKKWKDSIQFLFKQAVIIANLNQIAQNGCFIHYMPDDVNIPLEEFSIPDKRSNLKIHCINIHKSLCPIIRRTLTATKDNLFPKPETISKKIYDKTVCM